ncbi:Integrase core domain-containing protein [Pseudovibrio sp. Tun.PSC04-5.I4]|nr:Integrase core domain-containing protein [Pseudovibrio sp. Tun.PSC04-5.I4]
MFDIKYRHRIYYSAKQRAEIWDQWQQGESMSTIGRVFDRQSSSVFSFISPTGGIRPSDRRRMTWPPTQGKIVRWHQTMKNRILLENYFLPGDLEDQIEAFITHYNHERYHESLSNLTPADVYFGHDKAILQQRERIKRKTLKARRLHHRRANRKSW